MQLSVSLIYAFASMVIFMTAILFLCLKPSVRNKAVYSLLLFPLATTILLVPVSGQPVFYFLRGYMGDLSISSTLFFMAFILHKGWGRAVYQAGEKKYFILLVLSGGLFLYPFALGIGQFDPYRLGYMPQLLLSVLFCAAVYFWYKQYYFLVFVLTTVSLSYTLRILESNNLWDYLLDPLLWLVFLFIGLMSGLKSVSIHLWK